MLTLKFAGLKKWHAQNQFRHIPETIGKSKTPGIIFYN